jgi:hypothetical protein
MHLVLSLLDRFPAELAQIGPITTVYLIRSVFEIKTAKRSTLFS